MSTHNIFHGEIRTTTVFLEETICPPPTSLKSKASNHFLILLYWYGYVGSICILKMLSEFKIFFFMCVEGG